MELQLYGSHKFSTSYLKFDKGFEKGRLRRKSETICQVGFLSMWTPNLLYIYYEYIYTYNETPSGNLVLLCFSHELRTKQSLGPQELKCSNVWMWRVFPSGWKEFVYVVLLPIWSFLYTYIWLSSFQLEGKDVLMCIFRSCLGKFPYFSNFVMKFSFET